MPRYVLDDDTVLHGTVLLGGSPLGLFRLTEAGVAVMHRVASAEPVDESPLLRRLVDAGAVHPVVDPNAMHRFGRSDVTVIVPALGPPAHPPADAIVVDDGSDPPIDGAAIRLPLNQGPAAARQAGVAEVTTELVAFVDADVEVPDDWLDGLLGYFDDASVGLVAPRVATIDDGSVLAAHDAAHGPLDLGPRRARIRAGTRVSYVPAAAMVVRVEALEAIGGFDRDLRLGEDVDLVWRLDDGGWSCRYEPDVVVTHAPRATWSAWWRQRVGYGSSAAPLAARHPGSLAPIRMSGWSLMAWISAIVLHPIIGAGVGVATALALVRKLPELAPRVAFGIAWRGNLHAGDQLARAVRRAWWPILLVAATRSLSARRALALSVVAARHPIVAIDDAAYSIGVWRGVIRERSSAALRPAITSWPGRRHRRASSASERRRPGGSSRYRSTT